MRDKPSTNHDRGLMDARRAVIVIVAITVFALLASFLLPVAVDSLAGNTTTTLNQTEDTTYTVSGVLESNVTGTTSGTSATIELNDTRTSGTTSNTINVGSTTDYSMHGGTVTVGVEEAGTSYAVANYTYSKDYSYSDSASALWDILGLAIVLAALIFVIGVALRATDRL